MVAWLSQRAWLAALLFCGAANAWDSTSVVTANLPSGFSPIIATTPDATGYWATGFANNRLVLVRYANAGNVQFVRHPQGQISDYTYVRLVNLPDGGAAIADVEGVSDASCIIRRYDAGGALRWSSVFSPNVLSRDVCYTMRADGGGGLWVYNGTFYRLGADGVADTTVNPDFYFDDYFGIGDDFIGDPVGASLYLAGSTASSNGLAIVEKLSETGATVWKWQAPAADASSALHKVVIGGDGNIYAYGTVGAAPNFALYAAAITAAGQTLWTHTYSGTNVYTVSAAAAAPAQAGYVQLCQPVAGGGSQFVQSVARINADGTLAWTQPIYTSATIANCSTTVAALTAAANGDALVAAYDPNIDAATHFERFDMNGTVRFSIVNPGATFGSLQALADGSSLLIDWPPLTVHTFQHNAADGSVLPPAQTNGSIAAMDDLDSANLGDDGAAYIRSTNLATSLDSLTAIAADGHALWQEQNLTPSNVVDQVLVTGNDVCMFGEIDAKAGASCYSATTGTPAGTTTLGVLASNSSAYAHVAGNDQFVILYTASDGLFHHARASATGSLLHDVTPFSSGETWKSTSFSASGDSLIATADSNYLKLSADGVRLYSKSIPADAGALHQTFLADDGTGLLVTSNSAGELALTHVDTNGAVAWTKPLPAGPTNGNNWMGMPRIAGGNAYFALGYRGGVYGDPNKQQFPYQVLKVSLADGSIAWVTTITGVLFNFPQVNIDPSGEHVLVASGWPTKVRVQVLDTAGGTLLKDHFEDCGADSCSLFWSRLSSDGTLHAIAETSSDTAGNTRRIFALQQPFAIAPAVRVDQAGLDGAWFAPYSSGQGFTFDYIASATTIFMPWFTYTQAGGTDPAGLAWFTLQGSVAPGASGADLAITRTDPGNFNSGTAGTHAVGSAHLRFSDCNSGQLDYAFNADTNSGAAGSISLTRLSPSTSPCTLADGSAAAAQIPNAPAQGFDARQSGSWFDPATSGQGLELTVIPAGNGFGGLLFAAWFTFDPAGHADDPAQQHWFTLQGDFTAAANGSVTLPILRTLGGSFDAIRTGDIVQVGHAQLTMQGCTQARLDYQFDQSEVAHAFAGLSGSTNLLKIGGCTTP